MPATIVLLGPQRLKPTLVQAVDALGVDGAIAAVTAGWQEREAEVDEMREHLGRRVLNLMLHQRSDEVFARDAELAAAYRERQDRLRQLQELYRLRLHAAVAAARLLLERSGPADLLEPERESAIEAIRVLDGHHRERIRALHAEFDHRWRPAERPAVARQRKLIARILRQTGALAIAGGHVAVLLNRLRLFDIAPLIGGQPIVAWSAGAMALAEQVVLFHDSPPQGPGAAEVLELGLGLYAGVLPLPHARRRLKLDDRERVGLFARRFAPAICVALDEETKLELGGPQPVAQPGTRQLTASGHLAEIGPRNGRRRT